MIVAFIQLAGPSLMEREWSERTERFALCVCCGGSFSVKSAQSVNAIIREKHCTILAASASALQVYIYLPAVELECLLLWLLFSEVTLAASVLQVYICLQQS